MKIIVADDHILFLSGLCHVLKQLSPDVELVQAGDHKSLASTVAQNPDASLVVVDLGMPEGDPFASLGSLIAAHPTIPFVVVSASESADDMRQALSLGAMGFIPKRESVPILLGAIRLVLSGGVYVPPDLMRPREFAGGTRTYPLTRRQQDVLACLLDGKTNKEIARQLDLTEATVKAHVSAIFRSLGIHHRGQVSRAVERLGMSEARA